MRGRDLFKKAEGLLNFQAKILKLLPRGFSAFIWNRTVTWHGNLGKGIRYSILKAYCKQCGKTIMVGPFVEIRNMHNLSLGDGVAINRGCYIDAYGTIELGDGVALSHAVSLLSFNHDSKRGYTRGQLENIPGKIVIENKAWIGAGSRVLAGVHIGEDAIVGAGAVVTKDVAPETVVGGVPAKFIKNVYEDA